MARQPAQRSLTLTEELERLEQSITLTLQEIDSNFSKAHRIVTTTILPIVEQYAKHSNEVWEGSKFWKQFFEASANVSLSGYEEDAHDEDVTHTDTTSTNLETPTDHGAALQNSAERHQQQQQKHDVEDEEEEFTVDSPTQVTGVQTTPKLPSTTKKSSGRTATAYAGTTYRSPSPRKYTGQNPLALGQSTDAPSTPRSQQAAIPQSSPFEPESAYQPSGQFPRTNNDPLMHRGVLDKNYRIQATPHTQRRLREQDTATAVGAAASKPSPAPAARPLQPWDDSPQSSPAIAAPQLRHDLFSPPKPGPARAALHGPRTPGISILTPARGAARAAAVPTTSTGRQLFSPQDKAYSAARSNTRVSAQIFSSDDEDSDVLDDMSPPKTMQFHVPQSRLLQTPAREASKRIVEDLLLTAGAEPTDEIEGIDDPSLVDEPSPSVVRRVYEDDSF